MVVLYLDGDYDLEDGPNGARLHAIASLIASMHLPWLIVGDFNCSPKAVATSPWCRYLKGVVTAPNVPFTCTNNSAAGGSLIDFAVHARELTPFLQQIANILAMLAAVHHHVWAFAEQLHVQPSERCQLVYCSTRPRRSHAWRLE